MSTGFEPDYLEKHLHLSQKSEDDLQILAENVYFLRSLGNVGIIGTSEGIVLVDTGNPLFPQTVLSPLRKITDEPVVLIVLTHHHVDHAANAVPLILDAQARGYPRPRILAHMHLPSHFRRYAKTAGLQDMVNRIQFQLPDEHPGWPPEDQFIYPDELYDDRLTLRIGGSTITLHHGTGETNDATWIFLEEQKILFSGDLYISSFPNAGNPLKPQRFVAEWAESLAQMAAMEAEILAPGHGEAIFGRERIKEALLSTAEALNYLSREVVRRLNQGQWEPQIVEEIRLPERLRNHWALQPIYGCSQFVVRSICRENRGWFSSGNPTELSALPSSIVAQEILSLVPVPDLLERAHALLDRDPQLALHILDILLDGGSAPEILTQARTLKIQALRLRATQVSSLIEQGILRSFASHMENEMDQEP